MAKKKSKGFIIPAIHFLTTSPREKKTPSVASLASEKQKPLIANSDHAGAEKTAAGNVQSKASEGNVTEKKKLEREPRSRRKSALSLSSLKRNKQEEEEKKKALAAKQEQINLPEDAFDQKRFDLIWKDYIDELHQKGEKILASILSADHPKILDQMIHVTYPNQLMKKELLKVRPVVLKQLRQKLNNYKVDFKIEVKEENVKRFAYTPQEKYELLREKNKDLSLLRKTFNLEL